MKAKEIIEILVQADIIAAEADIETTYTQKREWIAKEILAKSKEGAGYTESQVKKLMIDAWHKGGSVSEYRRKHVGS